MRTILNVLYDERVSGPAMMVLQVARQLRQKGFETVVVIPRGDPRYASLLEDAGVSFRELDLVRLRRTLNPVTHVRFLAQFWSNVAALRRLIRQYHIEIVHTNGLRDIQGALAAKLERVPLVWHLHDVCNPASLRLMLVPLVRTLADRIAIVAQAVGQTHFAGRAAVGGRLHLLYAPVDTKRFHPEVDSSKVRKEFGIPDSAPVVGMVANICPGKGQEHFLEAASQIKKRYPTVKFLVVGGKLGNRLGFWNQLNRLRRELGLEQDVIFTGQRSDVPHVLRAMTVFVQASDSEACPLATLEASASGVPVVATRVGGTPELVAHGVTGLLIEPRNPSQIGEAVLRLLHCPEVARRIGMAGAKHVSRFFSLDACVEAHACLYEGVLSRTSAPAYVQSKTQAANPNRVEDGYSRN